MKKQYFYRCCIVLMLVHILVLGIYGVQKQGFHEDEYYSFWSSTGHVTLNPRSAYDVRTGYEIQRQFMVRTGERFRWAEVIQNQADDVHPPLYYLALNVIMSLFPEHFYKWFGLGLNMICSCVTLGGLLALLYGLGSGKSHPWAALAAGLAYAIAPSTVSNGMFIRMYAMSAMWTVLYACLLVRMTRREECGRKRFAAYTAAGAALCFLAFLTHYFCLLVPFFLTLAYCVRALFRRKGILRMTIFGVAMCAAIGGAVGLYPASLKHIFYGYRGTAALTVLVDGSFREMCSIFLPVLNENVFVGMMWPLLLLTAAAFIVLLLPRERDKPELLHMAVLFLSCLAACCFLIKTSLFLGASSCRYFYPVLALFLPLQVYLIFRAVSELTQGRKWQRPACAAAAFLLCIPFLVGHMQGKVLFLYPEDAEKKETARRYGAEYPLIVVYAREEAYRSWYMANQVWPFQYVIYSDYGHMLELPEDPLLTSAQGFLVYMDAPAQTLDALVAVNPHVSGYTLLREDRFFHIYLVE